LALVRKLMVVACEIQVRAGSAQGGTKGGFHVTAGITMGAAALHRMMAKSDAPAASLAKQGFLEPGKLVLIQVVAIHGGETGVIDLEGMVAVGQVPQGLHLRVVDLGLFVAEVIVVA
jgi:hypothetical protein